ncbi:exonuclease [Gemmatimonas aurantiaca T-27]|uniref:Exonuclease n=2 Tax=Gemmatimonas aurantiaca TaxID=173480 RepID=C1AA06_GEMAT|nr:3'-5' exonuclease [Gemmatimonas aurantiaca]BAH39604.1 exonuclease [Gemmatimonas aurantiaca T-27]
MDAEQHAQHETMVEALELSGDYQVLRRLVVPAFYHAPDAAPPGTPLMRGLVVDVETTGLDTARDVIIEFGAVPFDFDGEGRVYTVHPPLSYFEDPGRPIPAEASAITGITDDDVRGKRIDDAAVLAALDQAVLVIAHNAGFDRRMLERRLPAFAAKHWACSQQEVPWVRFGSRSQKLDYLLYRIARAFHTGHRAADDCLATLHLLASAHPVSPSDSSDDVEDVRSAVQIAPLQLLLQHARRRTYRLWATGTPIEVKDVLKAHGYRWFPGSEQRQKGWYRDLTSDDALAEEQVWLQEHGYGGRVNPNWKVEKFTALERYSERMG